MLEPKTQTIPFAAGVQRAADPNAAANAQGFLQLDNCVFDQDGAVICRPVHAAQTKFGTSAGGNVFLRNGDAVAIKQVQPYISSRFAELFPGQRVVSVSAATELSGRYTAVIMSTLLEDESASWYQTFTLQTFVAVVDSDGQILYLADTSVLGAVNGDIGPLIDAKVAAATNAGTWMIAGVASTVTGNLKGALLTFASGAATTGVPFTIATSAGCGGKRSEFDMVSSSGPVFVVYSSGAGVVWKSYAGATLSTVVTATAFTTYGVPLAVWCDFGNSGTELHTVFITDSLSTGNIRAAKWSTSGGAATAFQTVATSVTVPGLAVLLSSSLTVAWNSSLSQLNWASLVYSNNATPLTAATYPDMLIASRGNGNQLAVYSAKGWESGYQSLDTVVVGSTTTPPLVQARLAQDDFAPFQLFGAGGTIDDSIGRLSYFQPRWTDSLTLPVLVNEENGAGREAPVDSVGVVRRVRIMRLAQATTPSTATVGRVQLVAGSIPLSWDGVNLAPAAALSCPAAPTLAPGAAGLLSGVYSIRVVVECVDARGQSWFSPPSVASGTATLTSQKKTCTASVNVRQITAQLGKVKQYRLRFYSTKAGGSVYYLMSTFVMDAAAFSGGQDSTVSYDDGTTDGNLETAEQLYTQASDAFELAPPLSHICAHGNRFFGVRSDIPEMVMFTNEASDGFLPRWNALRSFRVDNGAGPALACASLNDSLVVFQAEQLCLVRGDGPTSSIADATQYPVPQRFASIGVHPGRVATIVSTAAGVFFVGRRNAYMIQPDLQVVPVGNALGGARAWVEGSFTRARYVPSRNQVWLFGSMGGTYSTPSLQILDLNTGRWTSATPSYGTPLDVIEVASTGVTYVCTGSGSTPLVFQLSDTTQPRYERAAFTSAFDAPLVQTIDLPWFRPSEAADMRLRKVLLSGRKDTASGGSTMPNITVSVYVQSARSAAASDTPVHTETWTGSSLTVADSFQLSFRSITQRCHAFRIRVTVTPTATSLPVILNAVTYMYGITGPAGKVPVGTLPSAT